MSDVKYSEAELRDGNLLGFDDVGKPIAASGLPSVPVTPFAQTLLDDADATTALSTLGVSAYAKTLLDDATAAAARETIGLGGYVNVKQFGAVGDGWTDDTTALQNAYLAACAVKGTLLIPNGVYLTSGLLLGAAFGQYCTIRGENFDTVGGGYGSILRLKPGTNNSLLTLGAASCGGLNRIMNLTLDGNKANQSSWSAGIYCPDISSLSPGSYHWGVWVKNVRIVNTYSTGIYIGRYRGGSYLDNVWMYACGTGPYHYNVHINNYDVVLNFVNVGSGSGTGIFIANASQIHGFSVNCYYNAGSGMYIDGTVTDLALYACSMDRNKKSGVEIYNNTNPTYRGSRRLLSGFRFLSNGQAAHNTYCDIACNDANSDVTLVGASFQGSDTGIKVAYNINTAPGSRFKLFGCKFDTVTPGYATAAVSNPRLIEGDAPEVACRRPASPTSPSASCRALRSPGSSSM
jgi:Pectate lyase superfamily protein